MKPARATPAETRNRIQRLLPVLLLCAAGWWIVVIAGCGSRKKVDSSAVSQAPMERAATSSNAPAAMAVTEDAAGRAPSSLAFATAEASALRREIIYVGTMTVEVDDVEGASRRLIEAVQASGGWVSNRQLHTDSEGHRTGTIEVRVPSGRFEGIHDAAKGIGAVVRDVVESRDVGKEFVDLEARLRNLEREELVIAGLFDRRGKISEVLEVERELARVRGEIEQIQGQLRYLRDQVSFSTLNVSLVPKRPAIERKMESWNLGYHVLRAWRALVAIVRAVTHVVIYSLIVILPLALVAWVLGRGVLILIRRRKQPD